MYKKASSKPDNVYLSLGIGQLSHVVDICPLSILHAVIAKLFPLFQQALSTGGTIGSIFISPFGFDANG